MIRREVAALHCLAFLACASPAMNAALEEVSTGQYLMGTVFEATLFVSDAAAGHALLENEVEQIRVLETLLSRHDPESALSHLNDRAGQGALSVPVPLAEVLERAHQAALDTRGAFDPSVGPLVALWTDAAARNRIPSGAEVRAVKGRVGPQRFGVGAGGAFVSRGSSLDLGGIAKGYALDRMAGRLRESAVPAALLSFGESSLWALGAPPGTEGWRLRLRGALGLIVLRDQALSVSGALGQTSRIEGREFGHVVDPRSGWPLLEPGQAVVVAPDTTQAEVLSTALLVLGAKEGMELLEGLPGCEGLLVDARGRHWESSGFAITTRLERPGT
jgi:thiamine biosynthesis lipoprotein